MRLTRTTHGHQLDVGHHWAIGGIDRDDRLAYLELGSGSRLGASCVRVFVTPLDWAIARGQSTARRDLFGITRWWQVGPIEIMLRTDGAGTWRHGPVNF